MPARSAPARDLGAQHACEHGPAREDAAGHVQAAQEAVGEGVQVELERREVALEDRRAERLGRQGTVMREEQRRRGKRRRRARRQVLAPVGVDVDEGEPLGVLVGRRLVRGGGTQRAVAVFLAPDGRVEQRGGGSRAECNRA